VIACVLEAEIALLAATFLARTDPDIDSVRLAGATDGAYAPAKHRNPGFRLRAAHLLALDDTPLARGG
jgi:hypothetical protein